MIRSALFVMFTLAASGAIAQTPAEQVQRSRDAGAQPGPLYASEVVTNAQSCVGAGGNPMTCFAEASPARCKAAAVNFVGNIDMFRRTYMGCLYSCGEASFMSRTFGECRK